MQDNFCISFWHEQKSQLKKHKHKFLMRNKKKKKKKEIARMNKLTNFCTNYEKYCNNFLHSGGYCQQPF